MPQEQQLNAWRDCIVVLMDLIGIKRQAFEGDSRASKIMRSFHDLVRYELTRGCQAVDHAYAWNDSVLLLSYVDDRKATYERALRAAEDLKRKVDKLAQSYAIAVKGQTLPKNADHGNTKVTLIRASSYAMANCFEIEAKAKEKKIRNRYWYVDIRIARRVPQAWGKESIRVRLLPGGSTRRVFVHTAYLWGDQ